MPRPGPLNGKRVLMTADSVGGVWQYALDLARGLAAHGIEVVLAVLGPAPTNEQRTNARRIRGILLEQRPFRLEWMPGAAEDAARAGEWLLRLAREHRPHLVHLNGYAYASLPWQVPLLVTAHSSVCTWWQAVHGEPPPAEWALYRRNVAAALATADLVVAPTHAFLAALADMYGRIPRSRVINNGRAADGFAPAKKQPTVLSVGRMWDAAKNLEALSAVAADVPAPVLIAGDLPADPRAQTNVTYLGRLGETGLQRAYAHAAVFASPARYEPFGLAVLEAALSGCALVLGNIPTLRELWSGAAVFVDPDDLNGLRETICTLLDEPETAAALGRLARRHAASLSLQRMLNGYLEAYSGLLDGTMPTIAYQRPRGIAEAIDIQPPP